MKQDIKKKWVDALRSGEYEQGAGNLRDHADRYCCLGVLCDLAVKAGVIPEPSIEYGEARYTWTDSAGKTFQGYPSDVVRKWAGLPHENPEIRFGIYSGERLAQLNDGGMSFEQIANLIEEQL